MKGLVSGLTKVLGLGLELEIPCTLRVLETSALCGLTSELVVITEFVLTSELVVITEFVLTSIQRLCCITKIQFIFMSGCFR